MPRDEAISHGCSGRGPWVMSKSAAMHIALDVDYLVRTNAAPISIIVISRLGLGFQSRI